MCSFHAGWQQQPVGTRRYHFILPCNPYAAPHVEMVAGKDAGQAADAGLDQYSSSSAFESSAHLLHGVLHINGFGHLLRINGLEGGSAHLTGKLSTGSETQQKQLQLLVHLFVCDKAVASWVDAGHVTARKRGCSCMASFGDALPHVSIAEGICAFSRPRLHEAPIILYCRSPDHGDLGQALHYAAGEEGQCRRRLQQGAPPPGCRNESTSIETPH